MKIGHIFKLILFSIALRVAYLLFAMVITGNFENPYNQYLGISKRNDSYWYEKIVVNGYDKITKKEDLGGYSKEGKLKQSNWGFSPFYPLLNKLVIKLLNVNFDTSALILSLLFSTLTMLGMYWFGTIFLKDPNLAFFSSVILFSLPFSFYFSSFYTEAPFLAFMLFSFLCIHYKRYFFLTLLLIPLTLLRINGIIILLPLYLYHLEQRGILQRFTVNWKKIFSRENILQSFFFISSPLTFFLHSLYQYKMTGFYFAFNVAGQNGWGRKWMFPVFTLFKWEDIATVIISTFTIITICYAFLTRKKLPLSLNSLIFLNILIPLCSGTLTSMLRYIPVLFPLFITFALLTHRIKYKYLVLLIFIPLHFLSYYTWLISHHISY